MKLIEETRLIAKTNLKRDYKEQNSGHMWREYVC